MGTTVFEAMSALAREHGAINLGQGFPDDDGPARAARGRGARLARALEPVPTLARPARAARRGGAVLWRATGAGTGPRQRHRHLGCDRGARRGDLRAGATGRRGDRVHPGLRRLRAAGAPRRRSAGVRATRAASLALRTRGDRGGGHPADAGDTGQRSAQSRGTRRNVGRSGDARRGLPRPRSRRGLRRGVGDGALRRRPPPLAALVPRNGGPRGQDRFGGQGFRR